VVEQLAGVERGEVVVGEVQLLESLVVEQLAGVERGEVVVREVQLLESLVQPVERVCGHGVQLVV